jgi:hypothetical protein
MPQEGEIRQNRLNPARTAVFHGGVWVEQAGKQQPQEASLRGRMDLGLAPMVQAQQDMNAIEGQGNPFSLRDNPDNAAAKVMTDTGIDIPGWGIQFHPLDGIAKHIGGEDFQKYQQAAKAFESQLMPIMSGAAVSPSEAQRQIKAALPELGDSPETLRAKSHTRAMMLNGAAKARGMQIPYPDVPTWGVNTNALPPSGGAHVRRYNPQTGKIE